MGLLGLAQTWGSKREQRTELIIQYYIYVEKVLHWFTFLSGSHLCVCSTSWLLPWLLAWWLPSTYACSLSARRWPLDGIGLRHHPLQTQEFHRYFQTKASTASTLLVSDHVKPEAAGVLQVAGSTSLVCSEWLWAVAWRKHQISPKRTKWKQQEQHIIELIVNPRKMEEMRGINHNKSRMWTTMDLFWWVSLCPYHQANKATSCPPRHIEQAHYFTNFSHLSNPPGQRIWGAPNDRGPQPAVNSSKNHALESRVSTPRYITTSFK